MRMQCHKKLYCTGQNDEIKSRQKLKIPEKFENVLSHQKFLRLLYINTVIVEIFGGFNFGQFRISPEFLISGGI